MGHEAKIVVLPATKQKDLLTIIAEEFDKRNFGAMSIDNAIHIVQMLSDGVLMDKGMTKYMLEEIGHAAIAASKRL